MSSLRKTILSGAVALVVTASTLLSPVQGIIPDLTTHAGAFELFDSTDLSKDGSIKMKDKIFAYTGKDIRPKVTVYCGETKLKEDKDYELVYENNREIGKARVIAVAKGDYKGSVEMSFSIVPKAKIKTLKANSVYSERYSSYALTGEVVVPEGYTGIEIKIYTEDFNKNKPTNGYSTGKNTIYGENGLSGTLTFNADAGTRVQYTFTGVKAGVEYEISACPSVKAPRYDSKTVTIYGDEKRITVKTSDSYDLSKVTWKTISAQKMKNGEAKPSITLYATNSKGKKVTIPSSAYTVTYFNNKAPGEAYAICTPKENAKSKVVCTDKSDKIPFTVLGDSFPSLSVTDSSTAIKYSWTKPKSGGAIAVIITDSDAKVVAAKTLDSAKDTSITLDKKDINKYLATGKYTIKFYLCAGIVKSPRTSSTVKITVSDNYSRTQECLSGSLNLGSVHDWYIDAAGKSASKTFKSEGTATSMTAVTVTLDKTSYAYTGKAIKPTVTAVSNAMGFGGSFGSDTSKKTLASGKDYTVSYKNNTGVGTGTVIVTGKGAYTGTVEIPFTITAASLTDANVKTITSTSYSASGVKPNPVVKLNGKTLRKDVDFTVTYSNNTKVGTASLTITGKGNYTGSKTVKFTITSAKISGAKVNSISTQKYSGKAITPSVTVKMGKTTLKKDVDYTISYSDNVNRGTARITITGKGNYTGTKVIKFKIK